MTSTTEEQDRQNMLLERTEATEKANETLKLKIKELNSDITILKRLVYVLNVELELRGEGTHKGSENKHYGILNSEQDGMLSRSDIQMLEPLLEAFEQTKEEKDDLLCNYKQSFDDLANRCKEIVLENNSLRQKLQEMKIKYESTFKEWQKLHEKFFLIEEHNQLLIRQSKLFQNKVLNLEAVYQRTLKQVEEERNNFRENIDSIKTELLFLKGRFSVYNDESPSKLQLNRENDISSTLISELKNLSCDVKGQFSNEIRSLKSQIRSLESQKCELDLKLTTVTSERDHLQGYISALEMENRKINSDCENVKDELRETKKAEENSKKQVIKCMAFIRELVSIHNEIITQDRTKE